MLVEAFENQTWLVRSLHFALGDMVGVIQTNRHDLARSADGREQMDLIQRQGADAGFGDTAHIALDFRPSRDQSNHLRRQPRSGAVERNDVVTGDDAKLGGCAGLEGREFHDVGSGSGHGGGARRGPHCTPRRSCSDAVLEPSAAVKTSPSVPVFDRVAPRIAPIVEHLAAQDMAPDAPLGVTAGVLEPLVPAHQVVQNRQPSKAA